MGPTSGLRAHPVPRSEHDRNITVTWRPDGVYVLYRVEIDQYTLLTTVGNPANGFPLDQKSRVGPKDFATAYAKRMRAVIPDGLVGTLDGKPITFTCTDVPFEFLDSVQFRFKLKAAVGINPGRHTLEIEDLNFLDKTGRLAMKFDAAPPMTVEKVSEPPEARLAAATEAERRTVSATVLLPGTLPPEAPKAEPVPEVEPTPAATTAPSGFWESLKSVQRSESLTVLLNSDLGLWLILLVAFVHGALHSLSPGHGKTMVAAYLVGEQGTPRHAVILGLIVTLSHTSAVFAVAILLRLLPERAGPTVVSVLGVGGGLLAAFIGLWLLVRRVGGDAHHGHSHSHGHGHTHSHGADGGHGHSHGLTPEQFGRLGWVRLTLLGISGGAIPCVSAILWVVCCVAAGRFGMALWVVLAFSLGLALVLVLIGLSVVWGGRAGAGRFGDRVWFRYLSRWLPIVGAVTVIVVGLLLARASLPE